VKEPDLREHERRCRERERDRAAGNDHEREQPDQVLRREHLREGEEAGDRSREPER